MFLMDSYIGFCSFGAPYRYQFSGYGISWCNLDDDNDHLIFIGEADSVNTVFAVGGFTDADSSVTLTDSDVLSLRADYDDSDCVLYMDFEDADGATDVSDRSASEHTITVSGDLEIDRAQKKFGSSGGYFTTNSDTLTIADHADFSFAGSDFAIEMWVRFETAPTLLCSFYRQYDDADNSINWYWSNAIGKKIVFIVEEAAVTTVSLTSTAITFVIDQWYHLAITREGNDFEMFIDGESVATVTDSSAIVNLTNDIIINYQGLLRGWMDEYRILNGRAEYTDTFTPPIVAHGASYKKDYEVQSLAIADYGRESELSDAMGFKIDANGCLYLPAGNVPTNLAAAAVAGGKIQLTWDYTTLNQPAEPDGFRVYRLIGATWTLDGTRAFAQRRGKQWISAALSHGTEYSFKICSYRTVAGITYESDLTAAAAATADSEGPAAIDLFDFAEVE
jgi:concanavalin A-like lectin/glucanase superfamily protein